MAQAPALADERRYRSLDALRGVAALSVVLLHFSNIFVDTNRADFERISDAIKLFAASPLGFLIEGSQAVLVFFVLSGFVLTLMLERGMHYGEYAVRRIARLYIPYIASIICAIVLIQCFGSRPLPDQSKWLNEFLGVTVTRAEVVNHVLFIGNYDSEIFNFVIWSLVLEMRISLVFPALLAAVRRFGATRSILASLAVSLIVIAGVLLHAKFRPSPTLHYILFFVVGINLALHRVRISAWYASLTMSRRTLSAIARANSSPTFASSPCASASSSSVVT